MKNKNFSGLFALILSVCLALTTFSFLGAKADGEATYDAEKTVLAAMEYEVTDLADVTKDNTTIKSVKKDGKDAVNGVMLDKETDKDVLADYWYGKTTENDGKTELEATGSIVFNYVGEGVCYDVTLATKDRDGNDTEKLVKVTVVSKTDKAPEYNADTLKNHQSLITDFANAAVADKKLTIPSNIWNLLGNSSNYPEGKVTAKIYCKSPKSVWSSSATTSGTKSSSSLKVTVSDAGVYRFYVLFSVKTVNLFDTSKSSELSMEKDSDWEERADGFYAVDEEAGTAELKIPVFTYTYNPKEEVSITAKTSVTTGKVGMSNSSISFTYENAFKASCVLMYAPLDSEDWKNVEEFKDKNDKNTVAEYDADALSSYTSGASIYFTPLVKGKFKVVCSAMGSTATELETAESQVIKVSSEMRVLKPENTAFRDFFKNNTMAVIFFGVALLCLIAIIVIACWKPKDDKPAAKVEDAKATKKVVKVEEKAPETTEAPAEEAAPETTEAPAEEVAPETTEAPAEEVAPETTEAPAEEAASESTEAPAEEAAPETTEAPAEDAAPETTEAPAEEVAPEVTEAPAEVAPETTEAPAEEAPAAPADDEAPKAE